MIASWLNEAAQLWQSLGHETQYWLWGALGVLLLLLIFVPGYYLLRHLAGHRKFRGNWYNAEQFQALLEVLMEDHRNGTRVMRYDELKLLRAEMLGPGFKPLFDSAHGGYQ